MLILADHNLWKFISWLKPGDINVRDAITGWTPLMVAVKAGHEQFVKQLISRKANLFLTCKRGESALWLAILHRNFDLVQILVDRGGANLLNAKNYEGQTPLMFAIQKHNESKIHRKPLEEQPLRKILKFLASRPALAHEIEDNHGRLALHHAATLQDKEALDILLDRTACKPLVNRPENNKHKRTPLMNLTLRKCDKVSEAFDAMISCGALVNCIDGWKRTILHYAASKANSAPIVSEIMDKGGRTDAQDGDGRSPFHIAAIHGCDEVAKRLLPEAKPEILELRDNDDRTAWQLAKLCGNDNVADLIAVHMSAHGINSQEQEHRTEHADDVDTITQAIARKHSVLKYQELHLAVQHRQQDRVKELLRRGTEDCNAVTIDGNTALHLALQLRELKILGEIDLEVKTLKGIIHELIAHDQVDVSLRNHAHKTPLDILHAFGSDELLFAMMEKTWTTNTALEIMHAIPEMHYKLKNALEAREHPFKPLTPKLLRILFSHGADVFREITPNVSVRDFATSIGASKEVLDAITHEEERLGRILEEKEFALAGEGCSS
jgi:ankyrin repeat protein